MFLSLVRQHLDLDCKPVHWSSFDHRQARRIVMTIYHQKGRFLRWVTRRECWCVLTYQTAREKTLMAMSEMMEKALNESQKSQERMQRLPPLPRCITHHPKPVTAVKKGAPSTGTTVSKKGSVSPNATVRHESPTCHGAKAPRRSAAIFRPKYPVSKYQRTNMYSQAAVPMYPAGPSCMHGGRMMVVPVGPHPNSPFPQASAYMCSRPPPRTRYPGRSHKVETNQQQSAVPPPPTCATVTLPRDD